MEVISLRDVYLSTYIVCHEPIERTRYIAVDYSNTRLSGNECRLKEIVMFGGWVCHKIYL